MARFDPEKMAVYRWARQYNREVHALMATASTRGFADLVAQLRRSCISIPANLLDAAGEWRSRKRLHYLMIARGVDLGKLGAHRQHDGFRPGTARGHSRGAPKSKSNVNA